MTFVGNVRIIRQGRRKREDRLRQGGVDLSGRKIVL
jgi:hypothetical protein